QAVGRARGGRDDGFASVLPVIDAIDEHRRLVLGRRRLDDLAGAGGEVFAATVLGQEQSGRLDHEVGADRVPAQLGRVLDGAEPDPPAIDDQMVTVDRNLAGELAVHRVVFQHVGEVVRGQQIVDADDLEVRKLSFAGDGPEGHASDPAEAVDCHPYWHGVVS